MKKILILNGVNLGELGTREVNVYGSQSFDSFFQEMVQQFPEIDLHFFQSDSLSEIVKKILQSKDFDGIILNPGAYTHTSVVLADAIKSVSVPIVEVHISNVFGREQFRKQSFIASACLGSISGFGLKSYKIALFYFLD
jgi:3-dehydroquinate dehydratase II